MAHVFQSFPLSNLGHQIWQVLELKCFTYNKGLFTPWTMKSSFQGPVKYVTSCWAHPGSALVYRGSTCQSDHGVRGTQIKRHILRPTFSTDIVHWVLWWERQKRCYDRKRQGLMAEKCCYNTLLMKIFFGGGKTKTRENMKMVKLDFIFSKLPFLDIY